MASEQWRMRVRGVERQPVSVELLVAAVMAWGEQLHAEHRDTAGEAAAARRPRPCRPVRPEGGR